MRPSFFCIHFNKPLVLFLFLFISSASPSSQAREAKLLNAGAGRKPFDITISSVPKVAIRDGGPPRDGIPALDNPRFVKSGSLRKFLRENDLVIGVSRHGVAKAYPVKILTWHEVVNDEIGGKLITVSYCPLVAAGVVYDPVFQNQPMTFGVTGKLYNSALVLFDRQTESLWSQIQKEAIAGPLTGTKLSLVPSLSTSWGHWKSLHPDTWVLSPDTGFDRDYNENPYADYYGTDQLLFPVPKRSKASIRDKERVIGLDIHGVQKAYPFSKLKRIIKSSSHLEDEVGNERVQVHFDPKTKTGFITDNEGNVLPATTMFWFAWQAFYPDTAVFNFSASLSRKKKSLTEMTLPNRGKLEARKSINE